MRHENCNCQSCNRQDDLIDRLVEKLNINDFEYCKCKNCKKELINEIRNIQQNGGGLRENIRRNINNARKNVQSKAMQFKEFGELYAKTMAEENEKKQAAANASSSGTNLQDQATESATIAAQDANKASENAQAAQIEAEQASLIAEEEARKASLANLLEQCQPYTCPVGYTDESNKHTANLKWLRKYNVKDNPQFKKDKAYQQVYKDETQKLKACFENNAVCIDPSQNTAIPYMDVYKSEKEAELVAIQTQLAAEEAKVAAQESALLEAQAAEQLLQEQQVLAQQDQEIENNKAQISNLIRVYEEELQVLLQQEQELKIKLTQFTNDSQLQIIDQEIANLESEIQIFMTSVLQPSADQVMKLEEEHKGYMIQNQALREKYEQEIQNFMTSVLQPSADQVMKLEEEHNGYMIQNQALREKYEQLLINKQNFESQVGQEYQNMIQQQKQLENIKQELQQQIESAKQDQQGLLQIDQQVDQKQEEVGQAIQELAQLSDDPIIIPPIPQQTTDQAYIDQLDYDACVELYNAGQNVDNSIADKCVEIYDNYSSQSKAINSLHGIEDDPIQYDQTNLNQLAGPELCKARMENFAMTAQMYQANGLVSDNGITYDEIANVIQKGLNSIEAKGNCDHEINYVDKMLKTFPINQTSQLGGCSGNYHTTIKTKNGIYKGKIIAENNKSIAIIDNRTNRRITLLKKNILNF